MSPLAAILIGLRMVWSGVYMILLIIVSEPYRWYRKWNQ